MKIVALGFAAAVAFVFAMPAQAATMSECAAQWKAAKAAKQTQGKTYKEFSKNCMGGDAAKADTKSDKTDTAKDSDLAKRLWDASNDIIARHAASPPKSLQQAA